MKDVYSVVVILLVSPMTVHPLPVRCPFFFKLAYKLTLPDVTMEQAACSAAVV